MHVLRSPPRPFWIQKQRKLLNVVALQNYSSLGPQDHTAHEKLRTAWEQGYDSGVLRSDWRQAASAQNWTAILTHCLFQLVILMQVLCLIAIFYVLHKVQTYQSCLYANFFLFYFFS